MKITNTQRIEFLLQARELYLKGQISKKRYRFLILAEIDNLPIPVPTSV